MKKIKNINLTWPKLIVFAIIVGLYTGIITLIPGIEDTSLRDISISFEWWVLFGIIIILNSKSNKDSALKCFIFFLISQPLVYLIQVPNNGFEIFRYYKPWFIWTVFTLPMGYIGYYLKKDNLVSLAILTPMLIFLGIHVFDFLRESIYFFPNHLFSCIFCIATMFIYVYGIFTNKRERLIGTIIVLLIIAICVVLVFLPSNKKNSTYNTIIKCTDDEIVFDNNSNVYLKNSKYGKVYISLEDFGDSKDYCIKAEFKKTGKTELVIENDSDNYLYDINIKRSSYSLNRIK